MYRHGPISIYELKGIGVQEFRSGWYGQTPTVSLLMQLAVGLVAGLLVGLTARSPLRRPLSDFLRQWYDDAGPALTLATVFAAATLLSITLLLLHIWLTPISFRGGPRGDAVDQPAGGRRAVRTGLARVQWRQVAKGTLLAIPVAGVLAVAVANAAHRDTFQVQEILGRPFSDSCFDARDRGRRNDQLRRRDLRIHRRSLG